MNDKQATNIASLIIFETVQCNSSMAQSLNTVVVDLTTSEYMAKLKNANKHWFKYVKVKGRRK